MPANDRDDFEAPRPWHECLADLEAEAESALSRNWQAYYGKLDRKKKAWADLLIREPWHWFATFTFKPKHEGRGGGIHPEKADKAFRTLISILNRELYGPRWSKHGNGLVWARGQEFHKSGVIHFHALIASAEVDLNQACRRDGTRLRRLEAMDLWKEEIEAGWARIEPPTSQGDVCGYVSKYVVKDGEVDFSPNFGKVRPPSLFGTTGQESGPDQT